MKYLVIRREQMDVFDARSREEFRERAFRIMAKSHPALLGQLGDESLRAELRAATERARGYGMRAEGDILRFLNLLCERGLDFERRADSAWAKKILDNPTIAGGSKLDLIARLS